MLTINNLSLSVDNHAILKQLSLTIEPGQVHVIMGPNGSGKSSLAYTLAGHPKYQPHTGTITFLNHDLLAKTAEERARLGVFLSFQHPPSLAGVNNLYFIRTAVNSLRRARGEQELDAYDFMATIKDTLGLLGLKETYLTRHMNVGFSGGEKKCNEILQMLLMQPHLALLDEIDSGLDVDALKIVAQGINHHRNEQRSVLLITHYQRILNYVQPDYVHILHAGTIIQSGPADLAHYIEKNGYQSLIKEHTAKEQAS
jgi:Fe-S cluster assembly ATP-binding protein